MCSISKPQFCSISSCCPETPLLADLGRTEDCSVLIYSSKLRASQFPFVRPRLKIDVSGQQLSRSNGVLSLCSSERRKGSPLPYLHLKNQKGSTCLQLAVVLPVFLIFVGAAIDFSLAFFVTHIAGNAAREGARFAVTIPSLTSSNFGAIQNTVDKNFVSSALLSGFTTTIEAPTNFSATGVSFSVVRVTVQGNYQFSFLRLIGLDVLPIQRAASMRYEWQ